MTIRQQMSGEDEDARFIAEICIEEARKLERRGDVARATGLYLSAAQTVAQLQLSPDSTQLALYNHAAGKAAALLKKQHQNSNWPVVQSIETPFGAVVLRTRTTGKGVFHPDYLDTLTPTDSLVVNKKAFPERTVQTGVGGTLVGLRKQTPARAKRDPFVPSVGLGLPVTATIEFTGRSRAFLTLHDLMINDRAKLNGKTVTLAADFTAPLATLMSYAPPENIGFRGMLRPAKYLAQMGLYTLEPYRHDKIPVVLVHGLQSRPVAWKEAVNTLIGDRRIRENYQVWFFRYPTGIPIAYSGTGLRRNLTAIGDHYDRSHRNPKLNNLVIIGHSMGGILSSMQIRSSTEAAWNQYFATPLEELNLDETTRREIEQMFLFKAQPYITRAVFIATPHRGSPIAQGPIGKIGTSLIRFPTDLLNARRPELLSAATEFGSTVLTERRTSISSLSEKNPSLKTILELPVNPRVTYHSIIANRGKPGALRESSDGLVPYRSSHLDRAASEKIVPSGHSAQKHPEAIEEIQRILLLHLSALATVN